MTYKGELEHRSAKASFARTDRREYVKQITRIERRQSRIRRIESWQQEIPVV